MRSRGYIAKRIAFAFATLFVAVTLNFVIFRAAPGDAVTALRCQSCTSTVKAQIRRELGLDKPKLEQYAIYLGQLARGNLGISFKDHQPVAPQLWQPIKNTVPMVLLGTVFSIVVGMTLGVVAAWRRGTWVDKASVWTGLGFYSMPNAGALSGLSGRTPTAAIVTEEEHGRRLANWTSRKKHTDLMQARAWFTRGLAALILAGLVAVGCRTLGDESPANERRDGTTTTRSDG